MPNTLKLYEAMTGGEPDAKARAFVVELDDQLKAAAPTKADLTAAEARIMAAITELRLDIKGDFKGLRWPVYVGAGGVVALVLRTFGPYLIP